MPSDTDRSGCQDTRDKIYALQGPLPETLGLNIDYDRPVRQVFFDAAAALLCHGSVCGPRLYEKLPSRWGRYTDPNPYTTWVLMLQLKVILDAMWHAKCHMGFNTVAQNSA
jgi:hypothetical protein